MAISFCHLMIGLVGDFKQIMMWQNQDNQERRQKLGVCYFLVSVLSCVFWRLFLTTLRWLPQPIVVVSVSVWSIHPGPSFWHLCALNLLKMETIVREGGSSWNSGVILLIISYYYALHLYCYHIMLLFMKNLDWYDVIVCSCQLSWKGAQRRGGTVRNSLSFVSRLLVWQVSTHHIYAYAIRNFTEKFTSLVHCEYCWKSSHTDTESHFYCLSISFGIHKSIRGSSAANGKRGQAL